MKKLFFILTVTFLCLLSSCKNNTESKLAYSEEETLKNQIQTKENNITWSKELESNRITDSIRPKNSVSNDVEYSIDLFKILKDDEKQIFPEFKNFGKLDISSLSKEVKVKIINICDAIQIGNYTTLGTYFNPKYYFNSVFFEKDLKNEWKEHYDNDYPVNTENKEDFKVFNKYIIGEPFQGNEILQIPVRFYCDLGTVDVTLYLDSKNQYSIYQINIERWGINDRAK